MKKERKMKRAITLILLLSAALFGFAACEGSFVDPGALEYEAVTGGGGFGGEGGFGGDQLNEQ